MIATFSGIAGLPPACSSPSSSPSVLNLGFEYTTFGRLRPLHTSAVIFAFGGNALIATSFYVVQRTCRTRLAFPTLARFVFWGYQLFIVLAATGYVLGITESREYAEPEWYVDLWLTAAWVAYLIVFVGTIARRREPHIYVANWFYLSFILTIAMLHIVNNLSLPVSLVGSKSYSLFSGVQDALTQWWYGHNAVGFFLTAGFLAMMYWLRAQAGGAADLQLPPVDHPLRRSSFSTSGPAHHLHYTRADWAHARHGVLGGAVDAELGRHDQRPDDPQRRVGQDPHRSDHPMMVLAMAFYGMATFEGPMMSIKSVNSLSHYTEWTVGHVHGALGWNGMITFAAIYFMTPRL